VHLKNNCTKNIVFLGILRVAIVDGTIHNRAPLITK
jgi:hypothetical protein